MRQILQIFWITIAFVFASSAMSYGQGMFKFPSLSEVRNGFNKPFKVPSIHDYQKFSNQYTKHLGLLSKRSEKAYRKSFLKFIEVEDQLLYSLCDSNEFRANALMRSSIASYGKLERDRHRNAGKKPAFNYREESIKAAVDVSHSLIPDLDETEKQAAEKKHKASKEQFGSELYADYMSKRVRLYQKTFADGTKEQKRLHKKLKKRAALWKAYKSSDNELISEFSDKHTGIMRSLKATPNYQASMKPVLPDYSGTQLDNDFDPSQFNAQGLLSQFKEKIQAEGILDVQQLEKVTSITDLFKEVKAARDSINQTLPDSLKLDLPKEPDINTTSTKTFWDRLYGGIDFDWQNSTGYYPDGLGISLIGGYKLTDDAGLALEITTLFNGGQMGFDDDLRFEDNLVSNYSLGANLDHRVWKFIYAGAGAELICNNLEAPASDYLNALEDIDYTWGAPVFVRALLPISGSGNTNLEFRYDLNSKNNIKPKFNFKLGFLIGR